MAQCFIKNQTDPHLGKSYATAFRQGFSADLGTFIRILCTFVVASSSSISTRAETYWSANLVFMTANQSCYEFQFCQNKWIESPSNIPVSTTALVSSACNIQNAMPSLNSGFLTRIGTSLSTLLSDKRLFAHDQEKNWPWSRTYKRFVSGSISCVYDKSKWLLMSFWVTAIRYTGSYSDCWHRSSFCSGNWIAGSASSCRANNDEVTKNWFKSWKGIDIYSYLCLRPQPTQAMLFDLFCRARAHLVNNWDT